jgi:putative heme iron utilization protein
MSEKEAEAPGGGETGFDATGEAKRLLRATRAAALATLAEGHPFASLVNVATNYDGTPILLLSTLAGHTRHLASDPRLSLLLSRGGRGDPLAHPRLTLLGSAEKIDDPDRRAALRTRFLKRHPKSALYADFADFALFEVRLTHAHLNGGFGRAAAFAADRLLTPLAAAADLIAAEPSAVDHINSDHAEVASLLAQAFAHATPGRWRVTGIDPEGLDLARDDEICRVTFPEAVTSGAELRRVLMDLAAAARRCLPASGTADRHGA